MKKCKFTKNKLILYQFNELTLKEKSEFSIHLATCPVCQSELAQIEAALNCYSSKQKINPPTLKFGAKPQRKNLVRADWTKIKTRKLIPACGFVALLIIVAVSFFWFTKTDDSSNYWSLKNSWEGPYRYHFEKIDHTIETIKNDEFFN